MVLAKMIIEGQAIAALATTYYTSPANVRTLIKKLTLTNPTTAAVNVTIYLIPKAGTAGTANMLIDARTIAAHETKEIFEAENHMLESEAFLQAVASTAAAVTIRATGIEMT